MVVIPAKASTFKMGQGLYPDSPGHDVTFTNDYEIDKTEVSQTEYRVVTGDERADIDGQGPPGGPIYVSWFEAVLYCNARSQLDGLDPVYSFTSIDRDESRYDRRVTGLGNLSTDYGKTGYRLPTDAEWEYACRAGTTTLYYWGDDSSADTIGQFAWYRGNSGDKRHPVGEKLPNSFGLYDMIGNGSEWCNDWRGNEWPGNDVVAQTDPTGPVDGGPYKMIRGGSYDASSPIDLRSATWVGGYPDYGASGFRVVLPIR